MGQVFYRPEDGWVGDVIPYVEHGTFHLFYLFEDRAPQRSGMPWRLLTTDTLTDLTEHGVVLSSGGPDAADDDAYTGSVVRDEDGVAHLFYTAHNHRIVGADGRELQSVAHAISRGGLTAWRKHPDHTFGAVPGYETGDWRDPFVFHDGTRWRMVLAARHTSGPQRRRGVTAQLVSSDLVTWTPVEPFWDPRRYLTHECPDVFRWGQWWYLVYSEYSEAFATRYRMARSLDGPWLRPQDDAIDTRAFYAAKSAERDGLRYFFGWIATRDGNTDDGAWQWAGSLSILQAQQNPDGSLRFQVPEEILGTFSEPVGPAHLSVPVTLDATGGYRAVLTQGALPATYLLSAEVEIAAGTIEVGVLVRSSSDGDRSGIVRLEPRRGQVVFDRWPREHTGQAPWQISGDVPYELARPCVLEPGKHTIEVVVDGDIVVTCVDRAVVLSARHYARAGEHAGFFVGEGGATLTSWQVRARPLREAAPDDVHASYGAAVEGA